VECARVVRHEATHLLSMRLGPRTPTFKPEGLARWKEQTGAGTPADLDALLMVLAADYRPIDSLLDHAGWERNTDYSYAVAGSFTGFLVRRVGWPAFKEFYGLASASNFTEVFRGAFGMTLLDAERQWRQELLGQRDAFEPVLSRRLGERRAVDAYGRGELFACLDQVDSLIRTGDASPRAIWFGASAHRWLGDFDRAADFLERALAMHDDWFDGHRADAWLELGQLYDLLTWRPRALEAYGRVLACEPTEAVQAAARKGLERPFVDDGEA
jgi:tetratricopeptide (TPR) repeat protein